MRDFEVHLRVQRGEPSVELVARCERFPLVILGPSGAGKTTVLECIAGLTPASGSVRLNARLLQDTERGIHLPPARRHVGYVMQDTALFPHLSVEDNVLYPLRARGSPGAERRAAVQLLDELGVSHLAQRRPDSISGGERARVALARALAARPQLLLLDEPFTGLDPLSRQRTQRALGEVLQRHATPTILVTHDRDEALRFGSWCWVMLEGRLAQEGPPLEIARRPADARVASFVGVDNLIPGRVISQQERLCTVRCRQFELRCDGDAAPGSAVYVCVRPEDVLLATVIGQRSSARNHLPGLVSGLEARGPLVAVDLDVGFALRVLVTREASQELGLEVGTEVEASFKATAACVIERGSDTASAGT